MRITTVACYVIQQNNCVCANQSDMCTCTHKIIHHRVFPALLVHIILSTVCSTHVKKLWFHWNTIFVLLYCMEYHLTVSRNKRNDILFIGKLLQLICTMYGIPEGTSSATFSKTVGNTCFMFYTISSVMLFVSVSSVCTFMFLVLKWMLASYFVECYGWSCVMFEERFTLCFKVVDEFSNVEIYVLVFFAYMLIPGLGLFSVCDDVQSSLVFFWLPYRSSASAILMWPNVTVMRKYAFPVGTNNIFIQNLHNVYKVQFHEGCFIFKVLNILQNIRF